MSLGQSILDVLRPSRRVKRAVRLARMGRATSGHLSPGMRDRAFREAKERRRR